ncbi:monooxygenase, partial [Streptomyces sp. SID625]|nr:monooxygenase [Streptomyces sp. SID625]
GQGGNLAVEDAVVLAHHFDDLAAYTAARLPRATALTRRAVRGARVNMTGTRAGAAVRDALVTAVSRTVPGALLRGFDGVADWRPPQPPYAAVRAGRTPAARGNEHG